MRNKLILAGILFLIPALAKASCGSAFCSVNTDWTTQGVWNAPGWRTDLRYEYLDQDQPRHGTRKIAVGEIPAHDDEVRTLNRNLRLSLDYQNEGPWGLRLQLTGVDRNHEHIHHHDGEALRESWDFQQLGDTSLLGRYVFQGNAAATAGVQAGLKLPTGTFHQRNAEGDLAERTLQPGTGTTDALLGLYANGALGGQAAWFAQAMWQAPLVAREGYRPGQQLNLDGGAEFRLTQALGLLAQINLQIKGRDQGPEAEPEDSGGEFLFMSPGLRYRLSPGWQAYGLVQIPLYQRVNGVQLTADWGSTLGLAHSL